MSIPSAVLVEEIKQRGFSAVPIENVFGEILIGYGHRIMNNPDLLSEYDSDLAHAIKLYDGNGFFDLRSGELIDYQKNLKEKVLSCGFSIDRMKAEELLTDDIINVFEELGRESSAFRHLLNSCGNGYLLPETQMSCYYSKLKKDSHITQNNNTASVSNSSQAGECFSYPNAYSKNLRNPRFAVMPIEKNSAIGAFTMGNALSSSQNPDVKADTLTVNSCSYSSNKPSKWSEAFNSSSINTITGIGKAIGLGTNVDTNGGINTDNGTGINTSMDFLEHIEYMQDLDKENVSINQCVGSEEVFHHDNYNSSASISESDGMLVGSMKNFTNSKSKNLKKDKQSKKDRWEILVLPNSENDKSTIRLDVLMYLAYVAGTQKVLKMKAVLACIRMDDFTTAAGYMLSNAVSEKLAERSVILSRRMRYGIMIRDVNEEIPRELVSDFCDSDFDETESDDNVGMEYNKYENMEGDNSYLEGNSEEIEDSKMSYLA